MGPLRALLLALLAVVPPGLALAQDGDAPAWGTASTALARPGSRIDFAAGTWCTAGFALHQGATAFLTTAGHCVSDAGRLVHPVVKVGDVVLGDVVRHPTDRSHPDVALIRLRDASLANATVLGWGGPRGMATDAELTPSTSLFAQRLGMYGQNETWGALSKHMRAGDLLARDDPEYASSIPAGKGDSGAPVLHQETRLAVGISVRTPTDAVATEEGILLKDALAFFARDPAYAGLQLALG